MPLQPPITPGYEGPAHAARIGKSYPTPAMQEAGSVLQTMARVLDRLQASLARATGNSARHSRLKKRETALVAHMTQIQHAYACFVKGEIVRPGLQTLLQQMLQDEFHEDHHEDQAATFHQDQLKQDAQPLPARALAMMQEGITIENELRQLRDAAENIRFAAMLAQASGSESYQDLHVAINSIIHREAEMAMESVPSADRHKKIEEYEAMRWAEIGEIMQEAKSGRSLREIFHEHVSDRVAKIREHVAGMRARYSIGRSAESDAADQDITAMGEECAAAEKRLAGKGLEEGKDVLNHEQAVLDATCSACAAEVHLSVFRQAAQQLRRVLGRGRGAAKS